MALPLVLQELDGLNPVHVLSVGAELDFELPAAALPHSVAVAVAESELVEESVRLIPRYAPEWTNHNPADPGVTLLELYAWMTEMTLYRLNKVPEKNFLTFLDLIGVRLLPPEPARVVLRFEPAEGMDLSLPKGTQVATLQAGGGDSESSDGGPSGSGSGNGSSGDSDGNGDSDTEGSALPSDSGDDGGCACRSGSGSDGSALVLLVLAGLTRRRRA